MPADIFLNEIFVIFVAFCSTIRRKKRREAEPENAGDPLARTPDSFRYLLLNPLKKREHLMISTKWLCIVVSVLLVSSAIAIAQHPSKSSPDPSDTEKAVQSRLAEIQDAAQALDPDKVFSFVLENDKGALVQNGKLFLTREEALQSTKQGFKGLDKVSYRFDQQHITLLSPTVALAVGEGMSSATTNDGRTFDTRFTQSVVLKLIDGEWKVFHSHRSFPPAR